MILKNLIAAAAALVLGAAVLPAPANAITYYFTQDGSSGNSLGGNLSTPGYGSVSIDTVGNDLKFQITLAPSWSVDTGSHHAVAFALATGGLSISGSSGSQTNLAVPFVQNSGSGPFSNPGFNGPFNYAIECSGGGKGQNTCNSISSLTFYVLGAGLLTPVLTNSVYVTADIYSSVTGKTGVVGATAAVPGPIVGAGLPGLLCAVGAMVFFARRRRRIWA